MPRFVSTWTIPHPPDQAWELLVQVENWPQWWPAFSRVVQVRAGGADRLGQRVYFTMDVGYRLRFGAQIVGARAGEAALARVVGDLRGSGSWSATAVPGGAQMRITWDVEVQRPWMRAVLPVAGRVFARTHQRVMAEGERGLVTALADYHR